MFFNSTSGVPYLCHSTELSILFSLFHEISVAWGYWESHINDLNLNSTGLFPDCFCRTSVAYALQAFLTILEVWSTCSWRGLPLAWHFLLHHHPWPPLHAAMSGIPLSSTIVDLLFQRLWAADVVLGSRQECFFPLLPLCSQPVLLSQNHVFKWGCFCVLFLMDLFSVCGLKLIPVGFGLELNLSDSPTLSSDLSPLSKVSFLIA